MRRTKPYRITASGNKMNKSELIAAIAEKSGLTQKQAGVTLNSILKSIEDGVKNEGMVVIPGFGSFKKVEKPERTGFNPSTNQPIVIPAKAVVKFKPGKDMTL